MDGQGDVFIADQQNNVVQEVNGLTGVVTTVAGGGASLGDGGQAVSASLSQPFAVAVDGQGNLYIADEGHNRIREVNLSTGVITTVAGNGTAGVSGNGSPATSAELHGPTGVAVDSAGDLFIADSINNVIREVNHSTGNISIVAGNGTAGYTGDGGQAASAELNGPFAVTVDAQGRLFIADEFNNVVREVNLSTGIITTVAGNGTGGFSGDGGPATLGELNEPKGVAVDGQGDLFIGDAQNHAVREINLATGVLTTVAGVLGHFGSSGANGPAASALLFNPQGVALDSQGDLFIADPSDIVVDRVAFPPTSLSTVTPSGGTVQGGGTTSITWSSSNVVSVDVLLSTNGGSTFSTIASNVPNFGLYAWSVPADLSTSTAQIKVVDNGNSSFAATSAASFTIAPATTPIISTVAGPAAVSATAVRPWLPF